MGELKSRGVGASRTMGKLPATVIEELIPFRDVSQDVYHIVGLVGVPRTGITVMSDPIPTIVFKATLNINM